MGVRLRKRPGLQRQIWESSAQRRSSIVHWVPVRYTSSSLRVPGLHGRSAHKPHKKCLVPSFSSTNSALKTTSLPSLRVTKFFPPTRWGSLKERKGEELYTCNKMFRWMLSLKPQKTVDNTWKRGARPLAKLSKEGSYKLITKLIIP